MPHDDWVRLWALGVRLPIYVVFALVTARVIYWHVLNDRERCDTGPDTVLGIVILMVLCPLVLLVIGSVWVITHPPRDRGQVGATDGRQR